MLTSQLPEARRPLPPAPPPSPGQITLRVLLGVWVLVGLVASLFVPRQGTVDDLVGALEAGRVDEVTVEVMQRDGGQLSGTFDVRWTEGPWERGATYLESDLGATGEVSLGTDGDLARIEYAVLTSPADVDYREVAHLGPPTPSALVAVAGLGHVAWVIFLVAGPQPRRATKWAWFWLGGLPPLALAFLALEPSPLWARRPPPWRADRLTGGLAFLIAVIGSVVLGFVTSVLIGISGIGWATSLL